MELFDGLFENKKLLIFGIVAYVIIVGILLFYIWKPKNTINKDAINYIKYDEDTINKKMADYYFNSILSSFDSVVDEHMAFDYLIYNNTDTEKIKEKYNITKNAIVSGLTINTKGKYTIYSSTVNYVGGKCVINIIEERPYYYTVTFDSFISYDSIGTRRSSNGINFIIESVYSDKDYIQYSIRIENSNNDYINIDFSDSSKIYIKTEDGQRHYLTNNIINSNDSIIRKGSSVLKDFVFSISTFVQGNIVSLNFDEVSIDGKKQNVSINI